MSEHYAVYYLWNIILKGLNREGLHTILRTTVRAQGRSEAKRLAREEAVRKGWGYNFRALAPYGAILVHEMPLAVTSDPFPES